ncbi:HAMP domain-containing sensor histidine kinase [Pygmaiobacter massiliensis]|uniref:HAMP domain-containing sensor histidine kinase n=1 Tax=Pygmaiobacter massiliensis TaxID=1917873 RepID=UPI002A8393E0|nr:HAMP domain-containing sensor histidine kinase [Pygmaiobacter massiliensis]MDY4785281.1 HAMP domain-containing sensor histidine kinase [Pygmaiobacter massiliensis]
MNKSISSRFFTSTAILLISSILCMGICLLYFSTSYFRTESENKLLSNVQNVGDLFRSQLGGTELAEVNAPAMQQATTIIAKSTSSIVFITDNYGNVVTSNYGAERWLNKTAIVPDRVLNQTFTDGKYTELGQLGGMFESRFYTAGAPLVNSQGSIVGYVFASSDASSLTRFLEDMLSLFIVASGVMLLLSSIFSVFLTGRMTNPLRKISEAAQSFGNGDFTARVEVDGDGEIAQLAETFNNMATKLEAIDTSRQSFMGNIAHELRTPMTTIKGFVDGMLDGTIPEERRDHYLGIVSQEVGRLSRLTRSMLDITKLETGEYVVSAENYDVWDTVSSIMFSREQQFIERRIRLTGFNPQKTWVYADRDIVHQVLYNIVDNAIKFTPDSGTIDISVESRQGFVTVGIMNTGEGIPEDALPYVFDRFYKADRSRGLHAQGSGLGLHICKQLISRSGGKIWVESVPGENTKFLFTLPAGKPEKPNRK